MQCLSCKEKEVSEEVSLCDDCYYNATGIDRAEGKINFRYSKDFTNPYAVDNILETPVEREARLQREKMAAENKKKFTRKTKKMTTSTEYGQMRDHMKYNPLGEKCDCSDLSISNNKDSGHRPDCVCMQCAKKKRVK